MMVGSVVRYTVLVASEQKLLMRPCRNYAVQTIVNCIRQHCGNGHIWHTTGSGKARTQAELALVDELTPLLHKLAQGRGISGLSAYEQAR